MPPATAAAGPGTGTAFTPVHPARAASARGRFYGSFPKTRFCFRELLGRIVSREYTNWTLHTALPPHAADVAPPGLR